MLDGKYGIGAQLAMKVQAAVSRSYDASYTMPTTRVRVALDDQEANPWFVEKFINGGAVCRVRPTVNPSSNWEQFKELTILEAEDEEVIRRVHETYKKISVIMTYNCTPYLEKNAPRLEEITAFSESSAMPLVNSVYGARSNQGVAVSALRAIATGVVPYYGYLPGENYRGQILVKAKAEAKSDLDHQLLGYCTPKKTGFKLPVLSGLKNPGKEALMSLKTQLNIGGNVATYHTLDFAPEAQTMGAAFQDGEPEAAAKIMWEDLDIIHSEPTDPYSKIDFALFGCPYPTIDQVTTVAGMVQGKRLVVSPFIMTPSLLYALAERMDYTWIIREAGGWTVSNTCMDQSCWKSLYDKKGVIDSLKCTYCTHRRQMQFVVAELESVVMAALEGEITL